MKNDKITYKLNYYIWFNPTPLCNFLDFGFLDLFFLVN